MAAATPSWSREQDEMLATAVTDRDVTIMGGRLRHAFAWWASWCESSLILSVIANGYWLPWKAFSLPPFRDQNHAGVLKHTDFTRSAIQELLTSGAAEVASSSSAVTCISPLNVAEQRNKCRLILDLRKVNQYLIVPKFKYEVLLRVAELAKPGDWMFSVDLKSGYHHIDIHSSCWSFLGFHFEGTDYFFKSLPFGLATAPFLFTQLIKQLARKWRAQGIRVIPYVDDILFLCDSEQDARLKSGAIIRDLKESGLVINAKKSHLAATQRLHFLGMELDTASGRFTIGQERKAQLTQALRVLLLAYERNQRVSIRLVARVTGILASMALALGTTARSFSHQLLTLINEAPSWNARVTLTSETFTDQIQGRHVLIRVDNQGVFFILRKGGSRQPELNLLCKAIVAICMAHETRLAIEWIPRALNAHADALSKLEDHDDYSLKLPWFRLLDRRWGSHTIDLFANANNAQLNICHKCIFARLGIRARLRISATEPHPRDPAPCRTHECHNDAGHSRMDRRCLVAPNQTLPTHLGNRHFLHPLSC
ncbi:unnamed protein product [Closterium sp. NIES-54]